jgi:hypothetical protein
MTIPQDSGRSCSSYAARHLFIRGQLGRPWGMWSDTRANEVGRYLEFESSVGGCGVVTRLDIVVG